MSRSKISIERAAMTAVRDWLNANRPTGVPAAGVLPIVADFDKQPTARPYLCVQAGESEWLHPKWRTLRISLVMYLRVDEVSGEEDPEDVAGWHVDLAALIGDPANLAGLQAQLQPLGAWLRKVVEAPTADDEAGDRARELRQDWTLHLQIGAPVAV